MPDSVQQRTAKNSASLAVTLSAEQSAISWKKKIKLIKLEDHFSVQEISAFMQKWRNRSANLVHKDPRMNIWPYKADASDELVRLHMMDQITWGSYANHDQTTLQIYKSIVDRLMKKPETNTNAIISNEKVVIPSPPKTVEVSSDPLMLTESEEKLYSDPDTIFLMEWTFSWFQVAETHRGGKVLKGGDLWMNNGGVCRDARWIISLDENVFKKKWQPITSTTPDGAYVGFGLLWNRSDDIGRPWYQTAWLILPSSKSAYIWYLQWHPDLLLKILKQKSMLDKYLNNGRYDARPTLELLSDEYRDIPDFFNTKNNHGEWNRITEFCSQK